MELTHLDHCVYHCEYHITIVSKYRKAVGIIKQNTARELKQKFPLIKKVYWGTDAVWSEGYFVSTVGIDEAVMERYIEEQGKQDAGQTKFEMS
jgi:putative transposase